MGKNGVRICSICGQQKSGGRCWFLIAPSLSEERLKVLIWQDEVATRSGIHAVCCAAHVNEFVLEWMLGTSPAFVAPVRFERVSGKVAGARVLQEPDIRGAREVAELCIQRAAVERAIIRDASSLQILVDDLRGALDREAAGDESRLESAESIPWLRQM